MWLHEFQWQPWGRLLQNVKTGRSAFDEVHGIGFFAYLKTHPSISQLFDEAMTGRTRRDAECIAGSYDFSGIATLADIGGGQGILLAELLRANPAMRGILFDRPDVVEDSSAILEAAGVAERCRVVGGDFFQDIPPQAEAYLLSHIIHDWDDANSSRILERLRERMTPGNRLLLYERLVTADYGACMSVLHLDLEMMVNVGGIERTEAQYRSVLTRAGLETTRILPVVGVADHVLIEAFAI